MCEFILQKNINRGLKISDFAKLLYDKIMSLCQDRINDKQCSNILTVISRFGAIPKDMNAPDEHKNENATHIQPKYLNEKEFCQMLAMETFALIRNGNVTSMCVMKICKQLT